MLRSDCMRASEFDLPTFNGSELVHSAECIISVFYVSS